MDTSYSTSASATGVGTTGMIIYLAVLVLFIASLWKIFTKAGKPGWASIIPIYNAYVELEIIGRPGWWLILLLIPFVNLVVAVIIALDLAKAFGKSSAFGVVGLILLPFIGYPMLAFGSAKYQGPSAAPAVAPPTTPAAPTPPPAAPTA